MRPIAVLVALLGLIAGVAGLAAAYTNNHHSTPAKHIVFESGKPQVKLAVLVVFDQMRGDYLERWRGLFGEGGFARLQSEGAWFTHCYYPYATTSTGPGHASMLSGTCPDRHGIINNNWFDIKSDAIVYCAGTSRYELIPAPAPVPPDSKAKKETKPKPKEIGTPERLQAETVADVLRATRPGARIFGLSLKDRSAILPTGQHPNGAYWFDGRVVTSSYYTYSPEVPHPWVVSFNKLTASGDHEGANRWFGEDWTPSRTDINYFDWLDLGSAAGTPGVGHAFRHPNTGGKPKPGREYYKQLANSPRGNDMLLELAKTCATEERLGKRDTPDLLVVSFSSNDLIGHTWGPDSPEVLDVTLTSDAVMANLLSFLDNHVGKGQYILAVTADHGVCPVVEVSGQVRGVHEAARVSIKSMQEDIDTHLTTRFGVSADSKDGKKKLAWVEAFSGENDSEPWIYFNPKLLAAFGKTREQVAQATAEYLVTRPNVGRVFTRTEILAGFPRNDLIGQRVRRSFHSERSGDVYVLLNPYCIPAEGYEQTGTTHGTPYNYDTHVPLLVYGPGIGGGVRTEPVTPQATAAIFSRWLGQRLPNKAEFPVPATLEGE